MDQGSRFLATLGVNFGNGSTLKGQSKLLVAAAPLVIPSLPLVVIANLVQAGSRKRPSSRRCRVGNRDHILQPEKVAGNSGHIAQERRMAACLIWIFNGREERRELGDADVLIGRQTNADVVLPDAFISRRHAIIRKVPDGYLVEDLRSAHGTSVNGERVATRLLSNGDRIELADGRLELQFWTGDPEGAAATFDRLSGLEKISCILDFQFQHGGQLPPDVMFQQILRSALTISGAERGFIMLRRGGNIEYVVGLDQAGRTLSQADFETSRSVVARVTTDGQPVFMIQGIDQEFEHQESIIRMNLRAVACMPLSWIASSSQSEEVNGIVYLDSTNPMHPLSGLDKKILTKLAEQAGSVFEKLEHLREIQERRELERELALAEETQRSLLPRFLPEFRGFEVHAYSQPTRHVGGDFYASRAPTEQS